MNLNSTGKNCSPLQGGCPFSTCKRRTFRSISCIQLFLTVTAAWKESQLQVSCCQSSPSPENWQETNGWQRYFLSTTFQASKARLSVLLNVTLILKGTFFRKELAKYSSLHFLLDNSTISSSLQVFGRSKKNFGGHGELDNCWSVSVLVKHVCQAVIRTQYWSKGGSEGEHTTT